MTNHIPPLNQLIIHAHPVDPILPPSHLYEVKVALPVDPVLPNDPVTPSDPVLPIIINTWGINFDGAIQEGNTIRHREFIRGVSIF